MTHLIPRPLITNFSLVLFPAAGLTQWRVRTVLLVMLLTQLAAAVPLIHSKRIPIKEHIFFQLGNKLSLLAKQTIQPQ